MRTVAQCKHIVTLSKGGRSEFVGVVAVLGDSDVFMLAFLHGVRVQMDRLPGRSTQTGRCSHQTKASPGRGFTITIGATATNVAKAAAIFMFSLLICVPSDKARSTRHLCERRFDRLTPVARYSRQCRAGKMMAPVPTPSVRSKNYSSQGGIKGINKYPTRSPLARMQTCKGAVRLLAGLVAGPAATACWHHATDRIDLRLRRSTARGSCPTHTVTK